jgi:hypothetical protein
MLVLDIVRKNDAITAASPFHPEQRAIQVLHDAQDLDLFARKINFAAARVPHEFLQSCRSHRGCAFS